MIRLPIKMALIGSAIIALALGIHGLYLHVSRFDEMTEGINTSDLFLELNTPSFFDGTVKWASIKGFDSWLIPACLLVTGIVLWKIQNKISLDGLRLPVRLPEPVAKVLRFLW